MSNVTLPAALRHIAHVSDLHSDARDDLVVFILDDGDGEMPFTNDIGERYILSKVDTTFKLSVPEDDFSGDPGVVEFFNRMLA